MEYFIFWIGLSILVGVFASVRRNRNGFGWAVLAIIISPVLAGLLVAILHDRPPMTVKPVGFWDDLIGRKQKPTKGTHIKTNNFED
jgi:hypothetical protein